MNLCRKYCRFPVVSALFLFFSFYSKAQTEPKASKWGPNDTLIVPAIIYEGESLPYKEMEMVWVSNLPPDKLAKFIEEWSRLRNAVYVTYPYARIAGATINDMNVHLADVNTKRKRKEYLKSREKELRAQFTEPMENLSVYQGKILMKLINRESGGTNCYDILKELKGGFTARFWQTVAYVFGSDLKQPYDAYGNDAEIESIVKEVQRMYGYSG